MKLVRFLKDGIVNYGELKEKENEIHIVEGSFELGFSPTGAIVNSKDIKLINPVAPSKAVCVGLNYLDHIMESKEEPPKSPVIFMKPSTSVIGPDDVIKYPEMSSRVDYEGELAVVIGKKASKVSESEAFDYIFGYTCANDVTARDLQPTYGQWTIAKGFDTFLPLGPCIATDIEADQLAITVMLNGNLVQNSNTKFLLFKIPMLVSYLSHIMTLLPGDVILTGTSSGVGPMTKGDQIIVEIEKIGKLTNVVG